MDFIYLFIFRYKYLFILFIMRKRRITNQKTWRFKEVEKEEQQKEGAQSSLERKGTTHGLD